jgi:hypothetical protein
MQRFVISIVITVLMVAGTALAHNGNEHIAGTVTAFQSNHISVKTPDGKNVMVMVSPKTKYLRDKAAAKPADVVVGTRVVIDATMDVKMKMYSASEVRLGVVDAAKPAADGKKDAVSQTHSR